METHKFNQPSVLTREDVRKANRAYRRGTHRGGYAALRARRILEREVIAKLEGRKF